MNWVRDMLRIPGDALSLLKFRRKDFDRLSKSVTSLSDHLARIERDLRIVRDAAETTRRRSGIILEPNRALALLANGYQIYVDPRDKGGAVNLLTNGRIEEAELTVLRRLLRPGMIMLDIGANYGYYSMVAAPFLRKGGRIIGFEPNPKLQQLYRNSIHLNGFSGQIEPHGVGVSDENGSIKFEVEIGYPGGGRIPRPDDPPRGGHEVLEVPVVRLDDYLPPDLVVDLVKIDVEGHEAHVLNGMRSVVARSPNIVILMEFFFSFFEDEEAARDMLRVLTEELGLTVQRIMGEGRLEPADFDSLRGAECTLALSRGGLPELPDLTFHAGQFDLGAGARLEGDNLVWGRSGVDGKTVDVASGPYLYLPKGRYRVLIDADFTGKFLCRLLDNFGDPLLDFEQDANNPAEAILELSVDARLLEMVISCVSDREAQVRLRRVEFWRM